MRMLKRWLALMLTASVALSDCGGITVFATEDAIAVERSGLGNHEENFQEDENTFSDETPSDDELILENGTEKSEDINASLEDVNEDEDNEEISAEQEEAAVCETDTEMELLVLHIGQIKEGEDFPEPDDSEFVYDLPVSFEMSDSVILFVNYNMDTILEEEERGTLVWSIIRGRHGMEEGSVSLVNEEDDWVGFEVVSDSPYFTMTEIEDEESGCYQMVELAARDAVNHEDYDYYIRAAYYLGTGEEEDEDFYAAATVPVLLKEDVDIDKIQDDASDAEETDIDETQDDASDSEETGADETQDNDAVLEESDIDKALEAIGAMNLEADGAIEDISEISETGIQSGSQQSIKELILDVENIAMHPGETRKVTATVVPEDIPVESEEIPAEISWKSSDKNVATVNENGEITAKAEGICEITARCGGKSAAVHVEVTLEDGTKLVDLSGDIWVAGFKRESEDFVYTGSKITQDIRVYHHDTLLKEKTDYTLSYKNNVNAAAYNTAKAPSVTITLKGQYSGKVTLYYTISPMDISSVDIYNPDKGSADEDDTGKDDDSGYEQAVTYSKNLKIPNPELTFSKKKLTVNKDFVCDYTTLPQPYKKGDSYNAGEVYTYTVNGIGNFTGSFQMRLVVIKDKSMNFSSAAVTLGQKQYEYHGTALTKSDVTIDKLTLNKTVLDKSLYDYEVFATGMEGAYVMVYPSVDGKKAGYRGYKKVNLKLVGDRKIGEAALGENWKESIIFSQDILNDEGGIFQEKTGVLIFGTGTEQETLTEGQDYTVKYSNAKKAGKVTVTFTGKGRYKGTRKEKYEITPNADESHFTIRWKNVTWEGNEGEIKYQKGGAVPDFDLKDQNDNVLKNKTDYTVTLINNKTPGTAMSCEINGKGNYKGYKKTVQINVVNGDIGKATISIPDKPYSTKLNAWKSKVTIKDVNGKNLVAGKDYIKELTYEYTDMESVQVPGAGTIVDVTVHGMGCYEGSTLTGSYRIYKNSIAKLKIVIDAKEYTGKEITLSEGDIHVYATAADKKSKKEIAESCYEIIGYKNNIKAGTAKVTLRGIGNYGGTKIYSFKIQKKTYRINHVKKITLDKKSLSMRLAEKKTRLTATITPEDAQEEISNSIIIWSTSNSNIATVETESVGGAIADISFKKEGTVTITATAQDGNKKAQCKITIVDVPLLKEADQTIEGEAGTTYQLTVEWDESQEANPKSLRWESCNPDRVAVDQNGLVTMKKTGAAIIKMYKGTSKYIQQCCVIVKGEEVLPEGNALTYERKPGTVDDTPAINELLREWEHNPDLCDYLYIPAGVYYINAVPGSSFGGIVLTKNQTLIMSPGALLMVIANNYSEDYHAIYAFNCNNITISGGQIIGDRDGHTGKTGESGHGIEIDGCRNVSISDVDISKCWGDGIWLGAYSGSGNPSSNYITIKNCNLHHNRRNNLSITDANNVTIDNCQFNYAKGTDPQYGIDIENNYRTTQHVKISNSTFKGNAKASMGIIKAATDVRLENCTLDGAFYNMAGKNVVLKNTTIKGEVVDPNNGIRRE